MSNKIRYDGVYRTNWIYDNEEDVDEGYGELNMNERENIEFGKTGLDELEGAYYYLRFYPGYKVLSLSSIDFSVDKIALMLTKENTEIYRGALGETSYEVEGDNVRFHRQELWESMGLKVDVVYTGVLNNDVIDMEILNRMNNVRSQFKYYFFKV
ncbi:hypothetical protein [Anthocerotibacter panamensis]|uniref:hypothetical protein n=1 Tax=Anthocerotibacter panamensis TaxID=2857077 RepID=UPI001C403A24|nr:hypothetical protein [Anthocerotibacter panamensis]